MWRLIFLSWLVSPPTSHPQLSFRFVSPRTVSPQLKRFHFTENKMGSPFNLIFYCDDSLRAVQLSKECFTIVDSLNAIFSDYMEESEINRLSKQPASKKVKVSAELFSMITQSRRAWINSGGTFDITVGALTRLWRKAKKEKRFPEIEEIKQAKKTTGFEKLVIDSHSNSVSFTLKGIELDFGGIVKGYAAQKMIDHLKSKSISMALADAGGDIAMGDAPPGKQGWTISINLPEQGLDVWDKKLELKNCAVATSGDIYNYTLHNGKKYSHIIDPQMGYGVTSQRNVTVIAKDGATADWLATACSILPIKKALALMKKESAALLIATIENEKIRIYKTEKFDSYFMR
ncbi:MAG: FAD:protein FMN transferase [Bacteroidetes bacterium]|nr:MAG: FAD:protein FMN transferase [Bacteroidota bacterium]